MTYDPFTFGNSIASVQLAQRLDTVDSYVSRRVSKHIHLFCAGLNALSDIKNRQHKISFAQMWVEKYRNHDLNLPNLPDFSFDTTILNVIHYRFGLWLEKEEIFEGIQRDRLVAKHARQAAISAEWVKKNIP